jgi:DNA-binding XRE family transcriptional regulator
VLPALAGSTYLVARGDHTEYNTAYAVSLSTANAVFSGYWIHRMDAQNFGLRLRELREKSGLTQPELAEKAGLSKGGIADWEQGRRIPGWDVVLALAAALGVDCSAFQAAPASDAGPRGRGRPPKAKAKPVKKAAPRKK